MKINWWDLFKGKTLLQEAFEEALEMMMQVKYMYLETNKLLFEEVKKDFDPYSLDKLVNKREIDIREKILMHTQGSQVFTFDFCWPTIRLTAQ